MGVSPSPSLNGGEHWKKMHDGGVAGELALYRGKSYELVAEADSSLSLPKISTES
jgi:hypothetical protein